MRTRCVCEGHENSVWTVGPQASADMLLIWRKDLLRSVVVVTVALESAEVDACNANRSQPYTHAIT